MIVTITQIINVKKRDLSDKISLVQINNYDE
ncbi:hypothetical protein J2X97_003405 [Epilithonimonas hungarica]|nr:hypothetical protein [Epilithonimonas hungarica]